MSDNLNKSHNNIFSTIEKVDEIEEKSNQIFTMFIGKNSDKMYVQAQDNPAAWSPEEKIIFMQTINAFIENILDPTTIPKELIDKVEKENRVRQFKFAN